MICCSQLPACSVKYDDVATWHDFEFFPVQITFRLLPPAGCFCAVYPTVMAGWSIMCWRAQALGLSLAIYREGTDHILSSTCSITDTVMSTGLNKLSFLLVLIKLPMICTCLHSAVRTIPNWFSWTSIFTNLCGLSNTQLYLIMPWNVHVFCYQGWIKYLLSIAYCILLSGPLCWEIFR